MNNSFKKSFFNREYGKKDTIEHGLQFPLVMGVLNVTPDSFSDGGIYFLKEAAVEHALKMFKDGADIVDIGGESTRPGSESVTLEDEKKRVIPVIQEILKRKPDSLLSIDTTKSDVAREACESGVRIINDISGLTFDPQIAEVAKEYSASLVIMHIKGTPKDMQDNPSYKNVISEIYEFLQVQSQKAKDAGVDKIIIDPGIGFGKRVEDNLEILRGLNEFRNLGYPILVGLSRKSFLGKILGLEVNERDTITSVAETISIMNGAEIIRTHNVVNAVNARELLNQIYSVKSYV
jgi:dihydropteroate synthase